MLHLEHDGYVIQVSERIVSDTGQQELKHHLFHGFRFAELKRSQTAPDVQFFRQYCRMRPHTSAMRCDSVCYILSGRQAVSFSKDAATGFFPVGNIPDRDRLQNSKIIFNDTARQDIQKRNEVT